MADHKIQTQNEHNLDKTGETSGDIKKSFDIELVCEALQRCIEDKNAIDLTHYLRGFTELLRFFNLLGKVFVFVANDVESKINILDVYLKESENGHQYQTLQSMIAYEKTSNLLKIDISKRPSGARTLLRLHRALEFVAQFMLEVSRLDDDKGTAEVARLCYKRTLAKYHPWVIKQSASLAMYTLPYRYQLVQRAYGGTVPSSMSSVTISDSMNRLAVIADEVFHATEKLFDEHDLLDLP
ncbi:ceramide-1-phosphate transfer protein-like [Oppia nitens]|uniref:ceramide-1-phosphate transfer protein-like n=1 Tax=Oppia nitens TaxID=1686743 RepID=UPI0023DA4697|nr:ceramide-1-phosphate transfer protein-like [Oppia nitens]